MVNPETPKKGDLLVTPGETEENPFFSEAASGIFCCKREPYFSESVFAEGVLNGDCSITVHGNIGVCVVINESIPYIYIYSRELRDLVIFSDTPLRALAGWQKVVLKIVGDTYEIAAHYACPPPVFSGVIVISDSDADKIEAFNSIFYKKGNADFNYLEGDVWVPANFQTPSKILPIPGTLLFVDADYKVKNLPAPTVDGLFSLASQNGILFWQEVARLSEIEVTSIAGAEYGTSKISTDSLGTLKYKVAPGAQGVYYGQILVGWADFTSGEDYAIAPDMTISIAEVDDEGRVFGFGSAVVVRNETKLSEAEAALIGDAYTLLGNVAAPDATTIGNALYTKITQDVLTEGFALRILENPVPSYDAGVWTGKFNVRKLGHPDDNSDTAIKVITVTNPEA